ncbi:MAG: phosphotransferase [Acidobacteria bacterium]|nr:phosphotransferase [Acidobacteriota bacterium]MCW5968087.1 phosphotransferase [Blastocatellales bacterium]
MTAYTSEKPRSAGAAPDLSEKRVRRYAARHFGVAPRAVRLEALTPDASTRKYYRISAERNPSETFIISLYPAPFHPGDNAYLDVTRLFERAGLPVPRVIDVAGTQGIILQEDLGDCSLARWIEQTGREAEAERRIEDMMARAIDLIARIQQVSALAAETGSAASRLAFDEDKLYWELNFFYDHFFGSLRHEQFAPETEAAIRADLQAVAAELAARPRVLCHRDYHAMNLMVDGRGELRVIDHQDARMGPASYDLVPLLVERRLEPADDAWVSARQEDFLRRREALGLPEIDRKEFGYEFRLMTVQRQLKATGTFSYQTGVVGRGEYYEKYIGPAVATVLRAMRAPGMREYPALRRALENF